MKACFAPAARSGGPRPAERPTLPCRAAQTEPGGTGTSTTNLPDPSQHCARDEAWPQGHAACHSIQKVAVAAAGQGKHTIKKTEQTGI